MSKPIEVFRPNRIPGLIPALCLALSASWLPGQTSPQAPQGRLASSSTPEQRLLEESLEAGKTERELKSIRATLDQKRSAKSAKPAAAEIHRATDTALPPQVALALALRDVAADPDALAIYQILKWKASLKPAEAAEKLAQLERAVSSPVVRRALLVQLVDTYEELGKPKQAAEIRRRLIVSPHLREPR